MLEGILYQGDKQQRRHFYVLLGHLEVLLHFGKFVAAEGHQVYVIAHKLHFGRQGYLFGLTVIEGIAQQVAQLADAFLRLVGVYLREGRDVVERIEQEMRVQLVLEPDQFGLGALALFFLQLHPGVVGAHHAADANGQQDDHNLQEYQHQDATDIECPEGVLSKLVNDFLRHLHISARDEFIGIPSQQDHYIYYVEPFGFAAVKELGDKVIVIEAIQDKERKKDDGAGGKDCPGLHSGPCGNTRNNGRQQENSHPDSHLGGVYNEVSSAFCLHTLQR